MNKKQISINMLSGIISSVITLGISFLITPYLVENLGDEAYGYIGLSNNFITIATIFTTALNSMANRFIIIAYEKKDYEKVNEYFSSLLAAGGVLAVLFMVAGLMVSFNIDKIFNITPALLSAVKITFILSVTNFSIISLFTVFTASAFTKNRLDLTARAEIIANIVKAAVLVVIFSTMQPQIYYVTIGGLAYTVTLYYGHIKNTKRIMPQVNIKLAYAKIRTVKELVVSGIWNSFNSIIQILMVGLDLALANWLLDGRAMGLISIASTITVASNSVLVVVINAFKPTLAKTYAKGDYGLLYKQMHISNNLKSAIMLVPIAGICVFASKFYAVWMPYKSVEDIQIISAVTFLKVFDQFAGLTNDSIRESFYLYNRLKGNALCKLILSLFNVPIVVLLVKLSGNYFASILIISGLSSLLYLVYYWLFVPFYASKITGIKVRGYYKIICRSIAMFVAVIIPFYQINQYTSANSWPEFLIIVGFAAAVGYMITFAIALSRQQKKQLILKAKNIIWRKHE